MYGHSGQGFLDCFSARMDISVLSGAFDANIIPDLQMEHV
jgi:hypothetical protein